MADPWLGHRDLCALQWGEDCDCVDPEPIEPEPDTCRPVEVDGEIIRVHGAAEMTDEDRAAFAELVRAVKRRYEAEDHENPTQQGETST